VVALDVVIVNAWTFSLLVINVSSGSSNVYLDVVSTWL